MTGAWVISQGAAGGMIRPAAYCKPSQQKRLPIIYRALFERLADVAVMGAQLMGDLMDRVAPVAEKASNLPLLRAKPLAPNPDPIEKNAVNGVPFCDHGSFVSWLRVRGAASTPFAHRGLLSLVVSGAVSPGPDISQVSGPSFLQDAHENCKPSSLLTVQMAVTRECPSGAENVSSKNLARTVVSNSHSPGAGGCVPGAFPVRGRKPSVWCGCLGCCARAACAGV